ncbi:MAG TPA: HAD family phosphatase [Candidatus Binataceae bacterium]|nr:HAD family phosphatase [Candidatus Binataceae bacterium]
MIRALIFDLDGTIADTEPLHLAAFNEALRPDGIEITPADYYTRFVGFTDHDCFLAVMAEHGKDGARVRELIARKSRAFVTMASKNATAYPGAERFVRAAAERFPLIVATGALRADAEAALRGTGLRELFLDIVTAEDAERGKPAPDPFVIALGRLGYLLRNRDAIQPEECLVIEDTPAGIEGARQAGMRTLGIAHSIDMAKLATAEIVRPSLALTDLDEILRALAGLDASARKGAS